ncbi:MAG: leucine-rich repeat protein [Treponema sp.]|jgi:hypothetical protein|nr:leucine-rich repeat protein [Treponema sp.]
MTGFKVTLSDSTTVKEGTIAGTTILVTVPSGTADLTFAPLITVSPGARVSPASGETRNFDGPVTYTVTAEDGSTTVYTAAVMKPVTNIGDYLGAGTYSGTAGAPVPLPVEIILSSGWANLLTDIQTAGKYVALDLSACTGVTEFDPGAGTTGVDKIVSLVLPDTATGVKAGTYHDPTFENFSALTGVAGAGIQTVGDYAFFGCTALTTVSLPKAASIGNVAFADCTALATVSLPEAASIDSAAFNDCTALTTVSLPKATSIGNGAFSGCTALTTVSLPEAASIGDSAFSGCTGLTTVSLPAAASIGYCAFDVCTALTTVSLPASLTTMGFSPFSGCTSLTNITVASGNSTYTHSGNRRMLLSNNGKTLICYPSAAGGVTIPGITAIGDAAFHGCTALATVSLPEAASIGNNAFRGCTALTTVSLPKAASIGYWAFDYTGAEALTVTLGSTVPTLGYQMFSDVTSKAVTVRVPSGATDWDGKTGTFTGSDTTVNWGNGFRGGGWKKPENAFQTNGSVNSRITLTVERLP